MKRTMRPRDSLHRMAHDVFRRGTPGCRCKADPLKKHGPYYQVSFTRKDKSSSKFVKKEDLPEVRKQIKNYGRMKLLIDRWIELTTELSNLRIAKEKE